MEESSAFALYEEKGRQRGLLEAQMDEWMEGRIETAHRILLRWGQSRFGPPHPDAEAILRDIRDIDRLERLADTVLTASSWQEFLAAP